MGDMNWIELAQSQPNPVHRDRWWALVKVIMNLWVL